MDRTGGSSGAAIGIAVGMTSMGKVGSGAAAAWTISSAAVGGISPWQRGHLTLLVGCRSVLTRRAARWALQTKHLNPFLHDPPRPRCKPQARSKDEPNTTRRPMKRKKNAYRVRPFIEKLERTHRHANGDLFMHASNRRTIAERSSTPAAVNEHPPGQRALCYPLKTTNSHF